MWLPHSNEETLMQHFDQWFVFVLACQEYTVDYMHKYSSMTIKGGGGEDKMEDLLCSQSHKRENGEENQDT